MGCASFGDERVIFLDSEVIHWFFGKDTFNGYQGGRAAGFIDDDQAAWKE